ncbi:MAG: general secretion pathway protein GspN [Rhodanobacteraceae bacterium]|nr:MAG: general secretion pathway protein GspN [Rhodanobacteraceae bacterium]
MNAADRRRLTPSLGILAALLALVLIALWSGLGRGAHWHDDAAPPHLPPVGSTLPAPTVPPLEQFAEVWQRPLFSPTRTPEPVAGGEGAASGDLELTGVIMLPNLKMAILHDKTTHKDYRVIEGRPSREGPTLVELHPRSAVVESSGSRLQLQLIPGPSPTAGETTQNDAGQGASGMVSRQGEGGSERQVPMPGSGQASAEARARELKARIEAERRRAARQRDGGG